MGKLARKLDVMLNDPDYFFLSVGNFRSLYNMTDKEIKESIIDDLLVYIHVHKMENVQIQFLYRFILHDNWLLMYVDSFLKELLSEGMIILVNSDVITIPKDKMQDAMNFCGSWYNGYPIPGLENAEA